jgi:hypothetical protein
VTVTDWDPPVALVPLQLPDAVQVVAFVVLQVSVEAAPLATVEGLAEKLSVGAGAAVAVTLALLEIVPPAPLQASV